jgi:TonB family protein
VDRRTGLCLVALAVLPSFVKAQDPANSIPGTEAKGKKVQSAVLIKRVQPDYPKKARKAHVEGTVRLHAIITKDGSVKNLEVVSGDPLLVDAALKAVRQWRYQPTRINGQPVEVDTTIDVVFALNKTS